MSRHDCCKAWTDMPADRRTKWGWQVLHTYSHSRVPFTAERLADVGHITVEQAGKAIGIAVGRGWLYPADGDYVGRLAPRRR
jgi:hypothetical protein